MKFSGEAIFLLKEASEALSWFDMLWKDVESFSVVIETRDSKQRISGCFPFYDPNASESLHEEAMNIKERIDKALDEVNAEQIAEADKNPPAKNLDNPNDSAGRVFAP